MPLDNGDGSKRIESGEDYIASLRGRDLRVFLFGELVEEPVDHPMIRPSINAVAATYDLALREPDVATVESPSTGKRINRFLHVAQSAADLVAQNMMQRKLGQKTGTCFQRCVGMDAFNSLHSVTYEIDEKTDLLTRLLEERGRLFFTHDHEVALGRVGRDDKGRFFAEETWAELSGTTL